MKPPTFILAGTYHQAQYWIKNLGKDYRKFKIITDTSRVRGYRDYTIIRVGTWYERKDLREIAEVARVSGAIILNGREEI